MIVIILAGGLGKRMCSDIPKVCHEVFSYTENFVKKPMIVHVIQTALKLNPKNILIIVGKFKQVIENCVKNYLTEEDFIKINWIIQEEALGTGHAIKCCLNELSLYSNTNTLILSGDVPLISLNTLNNLNLSENTLLVTELEDPTGCGRIILDKNNSIIKIVEQKDCSDEEKMIKLVNCGIYQINSNNLLNLIPLITANNKANEYYLTDIIGLMVQNNITLSYFKLEKDFQYEIKNINTKKDLNDLNNFVYKKNKDSSNSLIE